MTTSQKEVVILYWQSIDKPGSVVDDHLSSQMVAHLIKRISTCGRSRPYMQTSLQLTGFTSTPCHHGVLWALTPLVSSFPFDKAQGSFVSVALSLGLPPVAVSDCHALYCPDFPLLTSLGSEGRSPNELPI